MKPLLRKITLLVCLLFAASLILTACSENKELTAVADKTTVAPGGTVALSAVYRTDKEDTPAEDAYLACAERR